MLHFYSRLSDTHCNNTINMFNVFLMCVYLGKCVSLCVHVFFYTLYILFSFLIYILFIYILMLNDLYLYIIYFVI